MNAMKTIVFIFTILQMADALVVPTGKGTMPESNSRRAFLTKSVATVAGAVFVAGNPALTNAATTEGLIADLEQSRSKLEPIPDYLDQQEWEKVRQALKTPPVNYLWNLADTQNPLALLAKESGDPDFFELKEELSLTLQMCDQLTYDNVFVYFQPGNGKVKIEEPKQLAKKAMKQIDEAIKMAKN